MPFKVAINPRHEEGGKSNSPIKLSAVVFLGYSHYLSS